MEIRNLDNFSSNDSFLLNTLLWLEEKKVSFSQVKNEKELNYIRSIYQKITKYNVGIPLLYIDTFNNECIYKLKRISENKYWFGLKDNKESIKKILEAINNENQNKVLLNETLLNNNWEILQDEKQKIEFKYTLNKDEILSNSTKIKNEIIELCGTETKCNIWLHSGKIPYSKTFINYPISEKIERSVNFISEFDDIVILNKDNWKEHLNECNPDLKQKFDSLSMVVKLRNFFKPEPIDIKTSIIEEINPKHLKLYILKWLKNNDYCLIDNHKTIEVIKKIYSQINTKIDNLSKEEQYPLLIAQIQNDQAIFKFETWNNKLVFYWNSEIEISTIKQLFEKNEDNHQFIHKICASLFNVGYSESNAQLIDIKRNRRVYFEKCLPETWQYNYYQSWKHKNKYPINFFSEEIWFIDRFFNSDIGKAYKSDIDDIFYSSTIYLNKNEYSEDYLIQSYFKQIATPEDFNDFIEEKGETDEKVKKVLDAVSKNNQNIDKLEQLLSLGISIDKIIELINKNDTTQTPQSEPCLPKVNIRELGKKGEKFIHEKLKVENSEENIVWPNGIAEILNKIGKLSSKESRDPYDIKLVKKDEHGNDITFFIECKATTYKEKVFYLTKNEWNLYLRTLKNDNEKYILYRVYNLKNDDINDTDSIKNAKFIMYDDIFDSLKNETILPYLPYQRQIGAETMFFQVNNYD